MHLGLCLLLCWHGCRGAFRLGLPVAHLSPPWVMKCAQIVSGGGCWYVLFVRCLFFVVVFLAEKHACVGGRNIGPIALRDVAGLYEGARGLWWIFCFCFLCVLPGRLQTCATGVVVKFFAVPSCQSL